MSQHKISIQTMDYHKEIHALANRLGGVCAKEIISDRGVTTSFTFDIETMGQQFLKAARWYAEVEAIAS